VILVAADVWLLSVGQKHPAITAKMRDLLRSGGILGHPFVLLDLMLASSGRAAQVVLERYQDLEPAKEATHEQLKSWITTHDLAGRGLTPSNIGLLVSAHESGARLWTEDALLKKAAVDAGCAFEFEKAGAE
jgi:hypothetical protein